RGYLGLSFEGWILDFEGWVLGVKRCCFFWSIQSCFVGGICCHGIICCRINRKVIISVNAIERVASYFNSRLILQIQPKSDLALIVSRDRVKGFKEWLGA
ncbi:MAG: LytTR family transcriptional regulator, partial [Saprospiraceae bacterium]|nr:LytTR family transcriptional regulator [Saprospiraceae bacterium]